MNQGQEIKVHAKISKEIYLIKTIIIN